MGRRIRIAFGLAVVGVLAAGCGQDGPAPGQVSRDSQGDGLFHDFLDGKFDSLGHPHGAAVIEAETGCDPETGQGRVEGWGALPGDDEAGVLCRGQTVPMTSGRLALNVRALLERIPEERREAFSVQVWDAQDSQLAQQTFDSGSFLEELTYRDLSVEFELWTEGPVRFEIRWPGQAAVRLDYLEVFQATRKLTLAPASGAFDEFSPFEIEILDPPADAAWRVFCNGGELTGALQELIAGGQASDQTNGFRRLISAPADLLFAGCSAPRQILVEMEGDYDAERRQVFYLDEMPPCGFEAGQTGVLLTGFVPFPPNPADPRYGRANVSQAAVEGFARAVADGLDLGAGVGVMALVLPVEYDAAPALVEEVVSRCAPAVVISFGQGRSAVDVETTAYNLKDTSGIAGGVPDNRGVVYVSTEVEPGGPDRLQTRLPVQAILDGLAAAGVEAGESDDPGRYICNNVFYRVLRATGGDVPAGFIHLPRIPAPSETELTLLRRVVEVAVRESLAALDGG